MIKITANVLKQVIEQAKAELPDESCGYLLGKAGAITEHFRMTNIDHSPEHFSFDPQEQFAAIRYARTNGLEIIANWHSHPVTPARPSEEDIRLAFDPQIHYFILSLAEKEPVLNAYRIINGAAGKIPLEIITP
ncbi:MAG: M67 family metallopeptidase [Tannerellaceae bacterium]|nr:M67 family metallopeptidase [Tannerellaceae bacterium]MCD8263831.1 M67 family metallopeptidase [Tannerellaceae bacterium]